MINATFDARLHDVMPQVLMNEVITAISELDTTAEIPAEQLLRNDKIAQGFHWFNTTVMRIYPVERGMVHGVYLEISKKGVMGPDNSDIHYDYQSQRFTCAVSPTVDIPVGTIIIPTIMRGRYYGDPISSIVSRTASGLVINPDLINELDDHTIIQPDNGQIVSFNGVESHAAPHIPLNTVRLMMQANFYTP